MKGRRLGGKGDGPHLPEREERPRAREVC